MPRSIRAVLALCTLALVSGCAAGTAAEGSRPRSSSTLITFEEIQQRGQYSNLYDLVSEMRPRWVRSRGPDTLTGKSGEVQVHMDGNRLGPVSALRTLAASGVTSIEWLAPVDAAARFGLDHGHGAILVSTRPVH